MRSVAQAAVPPPRAATPAAVARATSSSVGSAAAPVQPRGRSFFEFAAQSSGGTGAQPWT